MRLACWGAGSEAPGPDFVRLLLFCGSAGHWRAQVAVNHPRKLWGFKSLPAHQSDVSGHSGLVLPDVSGHRRPGLLVDPLVDALGVEGEFAEDGAVLGDDLEVGTGDEQGDRLAASAIADIKMTESAE